MAGPDPAWATAPGYSFEGQPCRRKHPTPCSVCVRKSSASSCPVDRAIRDADPARKYWIRPAHPIEVVQRELDAEQPMPVPSPGTRYYMVVYEPRRGIRIRLPFIADDIGDACRDIPEHSARSATSTMPPRAP